MFFAVIASIVLAISLLIWIAELQATVCFVLDKGGLWFKYTVGLGRFRLSGVQIRIMNGHEPRAWVHPPLAIHMEPAEFDKVVHSTKSKKWETLQLPVLSIYNLGAKAIVRELNVKALLGVDGNAAATALLCGSISTFLQVIRIVSSKGNFLPKGIIQIRPEFRHERLSIHFKCIVAIKARHIIREVIENLATRRKKDGQSSN